MLFKVLSCLTLIRLSGLQRAITENIYICLVNVPQTGYYAHATSCDILSVFIKWGYIRNPPPPPTHIHQISTFHNFKLPMSNFLFIYSLPLNSTFHIVLPPPPHNFQSPYPDAHHMLPDIKLTRVMSGILWHCFRTRYILSWYNVENTISKIQAHHVSSILWHCTTICKEMNWCVWSLSTLFMLHWTKRRGPGDEINDETCSWVGSNQRHKTSFIDNPSGTQDNVMYIQS